MFGFFYAIEPMKEVGWNIDQVRCEGKPGIYLSVQIFIESPLRLVEPLPKMIFALQPDRLPVVTIQRILHRMGFEMIGLNYE